MALQRIMKIERIGSGSPPTDWVIVYWNDSSNEVEVWWHRYADESSDATPTPVQVGSSSDDTIFGALKDTGGSSLPFQNPSVETLNIFYYDYRYCDGTTLVEFFPINDPVHGYAALPDFPFTYRLFTADSPVCAAGQVVCDLYIDESSIIVVPETTPGSSFDAEVTMTAVTSNGPVQWSAGGVVTFDSNSSSGNRYTILWHTKLTGGGIGNTGYTFSVVDSNGCRASKFINVASYVPETNPDEVGTYYGVRWRLDNWEDLEGIPCRLDILRKSYSGATDEVKGGSEPFNVLYRGEKEIKHFPLVGSEVNVDLISETNMQYSSLFTTDEKTHLAKIYKDYGSGYVLYWQGFLLTDLYQEPFVSPPYTVNMKFTDGLGTLKNIPFTDPSGENYTSRISYLQAITNILNKTEIGLNLRIGVNIYATGMDSGADDCPFEQLYFDPTIYYDEDGTPKDCDYVLSELLRPFGARILQAEGYWNIERVKEKYAAIDYREWKLNGEYVGNGSFGGDVNNDDKSQTSRIVQTNRSAILSFVPGYGKINITKNLSLSNNMLTNGGFEKPLSVGWTPKPFSGTGVSWGTTFINDRNAFIAEFGDNATVGAQITLVSKTFDYTKSLTADTIRFKFDYLLDTLVKYPYLYFEWSLKMSTWYLQADGSWSSSSSNEYNRVFSGDFGKWNTIEVTPRASSAYSGSTIYVKFKLYGNHPYDYSNTTNLKAATTTSLPVGYKVKQLDTTGSVTLVRYYELDATTESESLPTIVQPNDYNVSTNTKKWRQTDVISYSGSLANQLNAILLDNVEVAFLANGLEPEGEEIITQTLNPKNTNTLEVEVLHADITDEFNNAGLITKNYFTLSDGTQTTNWADDGVTQPLIDFLKDDYALQYKNHLKRLNYTGLSDTVINPLKSIVETMDDNTRYMVLGLGHSHRKNAYDLEIVEHKVEPFNQPSPTYGAFDNQEFSIAFDI